MCDPPTVSIMYYKLEDKLNMSFFTIYSQIGLQHRPKYLLFSLGKTLGKPEVPDTLDAEDYLNTHFPCNCCHPNNVFPTVRVQIASCRASNLRTILHSSQEDVLA